MGYQFSKETIQRVARKQYELNYEASMKKSNVIHIDNDASRLQAVNALIASKISCEAC